MNVSTSEATVINRMSLIAVVSDEQSCINIYIYVERWEHLKNRGISQKMILTVNHDAALCFHTTELVCGLTPVGGAVGRLYLFARQRQTFPILRQFILLTLVDLLALAEPLHLGRWLAKVDAARQLHLAWSNEHCVFQVLDELGRIAS